jgi:hypothetical protein
MIETPKEGYWLSEPNIKTIENLKNAIYMGPWCVKTKTGSWTEQPVDIFYQEKPEKETFSKYFGIYRDEHNQIFICDGSSAFSEDISALKLNNGRVLVSRYVHDYVATATGEMIDGGRNYTRYTPTSSSSLIRIRVKDDKFVEVEDASDE